MVKNLKPDIAALAKIDMGIGGAIVTAAGGNDVDYVCRFFAPSEGIDEDPATGSIQCSLVPYWAGRTGKQTFRVQQLSSRGARIRTAGWAVNSLSEAMEKRTMRIEITLFGNSL